MAEPPAPEEMWEEILLRLPPDDPASLFRASLVCKLWLRISSGRGFLRRFAQLHRAPPMLGFFERPGGFVPTTAGGAFSLPAPGPDRSTWPDALDCRHGRVLLFNSSPCGFLVWEPITGYQRLVPFPEAEDLETFNAAVVCAAYGCDHWSCHGGPFRVVVVGASGGGDSFASAMEYPSETGAWSQPTTIPIADDSSMPLRPTILMGNCLYFLCDYYSEIIRYDLREQGQLAVIDMVDPTIDYGWGVTLMQAEDGELWVAGVECTSLHLWSRQTTGLTDDDVDAAGWVLRRTIHLKNLLPATALEKVAIQVIGFAEGTDVILMKTIDGVFTIELKSGQARKVCARSKTSTLLPFLSFYTPGTHGMQANAGE